MRISGPLFVLIGSICFSFSGVIQCIAPTGATPFTITEARMAIGSLGLLTFCFLSKKWPSSWKRFNFKYLFLMAAFLYSYQLLFFTSVLKTGVAIGTIAAIGSTPIWSAVIDWAFHRQKPSTIWYVSTGIAIGGIVLLNVDFLSSSIHWGYLLAPLLAGACYAFQIEVAPKAMQGISSESAIAFVMGLVAVVNIPSLYFFPPDWILTIRGFCCALGMGIVTASIAFTFFFAGVRQTNSVVASTLSLAEPMGAALWGILLLQEPWTTNTLVGIFFVIFSLVILLLTKKQ